MTARSASKSTRVVLVGLLLTVVSLAAASSASAAAWPGPGAVSFADDAGAFAGDISGLAYQPSGSAGPGVMWAVQNGSGTLFRLVWDGTKWTPDAANGWGAGKTLHYTDGTGTPDAEGVTLADGDPNGVYVASERNGNFGGTSRPSVLRYDASSPAATLTATGEWNLTPNLPGLAPNAGPEAVTWVPDAVLVDRGFVDEATGTAYNPGTYANHGSGLFFVGVEQTGEVIAYAFNLSNGTFTRVATIASGFPAVMALEFEAETNLLWAVCDNTCNGQLSTLDVAQSGANDGHYAVKATYDRPAGMANLNNEGFAIAPRAECTGSLKPVFWADDGATDGHSLRAGKLGCTDPPAPPQPPGPTPGPAPQPGPTPAPADTTAPVLSRVTASRKRVAFRLSEDASVKVTIEKRSGRRYKRLKAFKVATKAGSRKIAFKRRVSAAKLKRGKLRISLQATDAAGNKSKTVRKVVR